MFCVYFFVNNHLKKIYLRKQKNSVTISIVEDDDTMPDVIPNPVFKFEHAFAHHPKIMAKLKCLGFEKPSPIQCQLWPYLMLGHDTVGIAQTGTGMVTYYISTF